MSMGVSSVPDALASGAMVYIGKLDNDYSQPMHQNAVKKEFLTYFANHIRIISSMDDIVVFHKIYASVSPF